jgi:hypothetical protein
MDKENQSKSTRELVETIFCEHPDWNGREIYEHYLTLIGDTQKAVTLNAVQKQVEKLRPKYKEITSAGLDASWHLGTLDSFPLPAESIPYILKIQKIQPDNRLTLRQALWISRLCNMIKDVELLGKLAFQYAERQRLCQITGVELNTTEMDKILLQDKEAILKYLSGSGPVGSGNSDTKAVKSERGKEIQEELWVITFKNGGAYGVGKSGSELYLGTHEEVVTFLTRNNSIREYRKADNGEIYVTLNKKYVYIGGG